MMNMLDHDGKTYLILEALGDHKDWADDFDVAAIEVTPEIIAGWRETLSLAAQLHAEHGIDYIAFIDGSPEYYGGDHDAEYLNDDLPQPLWTSEPGRTDDDHMEVGRDWFFWSCYIKHGDTRVETAALTATDLDDLDAQLAL